MAFSMFDVWDQALLTHVINRPPDGLVAGAAEDTTPLLGAQIAPLRPVNTRNVKVSISDLRPFGTGPARAPDATPPLHKPSVSRQETILELILLDEMERISEEDWMKLNSDDEQYRLSAGASLVDRGRILKIRNQRATEKLRWQAFTGTATVRFADSADQVVIDYGLPAGHKPTASVLWSDTTNADPVSDVQAWAEVLATDTGFYGSKLHMNSKTYTYLLNNTKLKNAMNFYANSAPAYLRVRPEDITNLFTSYFSNVQVILYDNGYREEGTSGFGLGSTTKYIPDGYVLMTTDYTLDGVPIADMPDGLVQVRTGYNQTALRQGEQAEVLVEGIPGNHLLRYASARIPRLLIPEAFMWIRVA